MSKVWEARDDRIGEHFVLKRIEVTCAGEFAKRCQSFVSSLGTRVEHIALIDLFRFGMKYSLSFVRLTSASCLSSVVMGRFLHTWRHSLPIIDNNVAAKIFLSLSPSFAAVA